MTLESIVELIAQRLNLTSSTALARIADSVNERYAMVLGAVGLQVSTQGTVNANTAVDYRYVVFEGLEKLLGVYKDAAPRVLEERTFTQLRNSIERSGSPQQYAITNVTSDTVTIFLDSTPSAVETLFADALINQAPLGPGDGPQFPGIYHDILVIGGMATELEKMEKIELADRAEKRFQIRLSELRYFLATSAYLDIVQGGGSNGRVRNQTNLLV
jgi:hypothetical protein